MKKICLFSTKVIKDIEGAEAELYVNFYLVLDRDYIFTFLIDAPDLACSDRHPIKLWKHFLILLEEETVKYLRRYEENRKRVYIPLELLSEIKESVENISTNFLIEDGAVAVGTQEKGPVEVKQEVIDIIDKCINAYKE